MKYWSLEDVEGSVLPEDVRNLTLLVQSQVSELSDRPYPRVVGGSHEDGPDGTDVCEIVVEVKPGLLLPTEYESEVWEESLQASTDEIVIRVFEGLTVALEHHQLLLSKVDEVRREARVLAAEAQAKGLAIRLLSVQLTPYDHWRGSLEPSFQVKFEELDDRLLPAPMWVHVASAAELRPEVEGSLERLRERCDTRQSLGRAGADGTIDALALACIRRQDDLWSILSLLMTEERIWLGDDTCVSWRDGHLSCMSNNDLERMGWFGDWITLENRLLDPQTAKAAIGRSVTELVDNPLLSDEMRVLDVERRIEEGHLSTAIRLELQRLYFCAQTGRTWQVPPAVQTPSSGAGVKPLLRIV